jgi:hypothetical protein
MVCFCLPLPCEGNLTVRNLDMITLVKSMSEDIATEKVIKDVEYDIVQRKLKESTDTLAETRKELGQLRSRSDELERINESIANLKDSSEDFDWTGRSQPLERPTDSSVPSAFRRRKDLPPSSAHFPGVDTENLVELALHPESSSVENLVMLRRMKLWHERIAILLTRRQASREGHAAEKEHQLRKLVALCTGFSATEADEVCVSMSFSFNTYALVIIASRLVTGVYRK